MRRNALTAALLLSTAAISACSAPENSGSSTGDGMNAATTDMRETAAAPQAMRMPGIAPTSAPGVAFTYRYAFVLPDVRIADVQEQHAGACEKLGPSRCRIAGMRYTLVNEDQVEAYLNFKLSPELARQFGKEGIAAIDKADGKLVDAQIDGEDVGSQITSSQQRSASLKAELERIEARLTGRALGDRERAELQQQAEALRQQLSGESDTRRAGEEQLANTPMTFTYTGTDGFRLGSNPFADAMHRTWDSAVAMVSIVLLGLGVALPWLLLALVAAVIWRSPPIRALRRYLVPARAAAVQPAPPTGPEGAG